MIPWWMVPISASAGFLLAAMFSASEGRRPAKIEELLIEVIKSCRIGNEAMRLIANELVNKEKREQ